MYTVFVPMHWLCGLSPLAKKLLPERGSGKIPRAFFLGSELNGSRVSLLRLPKFLHRRSQ